MCDPISIGGLVLSGIGGLVQGQQQTAYVNAQNRANQQAYMRSKDAREAERARQKLMEGEATSAWQSTLDALSPDERAAAEAEAKTKFMANYDAGQNDTTAGQFLSGQEYAAPEIKESIAATTAKAASEARQRAAALASLSGGGTVDMARGEILGNNANWLQTLNGLRRGSLGVSQFEQNIQPATVTPGNNFLGSILTGVGSTVAGMGGGGSPASPFAGWSWAPNASSHAAKLGV